MDNELLQGARNAAWVCMKENFSDRVFMLTDREIAIITRVLETKAKMVVNRGRCVGRPVALSKHCIRRVV